MKENRSPHPDAEWWTVAQFQQRVPVGLTKTYEMINSGELPSIVVGRKRLISVAGARRRFGTVQVAA